MELKHIEELEKANQKGHADRVRLGFKDASVAKKGLMLDELKSKGKVQQDPALLAAVVFFILRGLLGTTSS